MFSLGVRGERDTENYGTEEHQKGLGPLLHDRIADTLVSLCHKGTCGRTNTKVPSTLVDRLRIVTNARVLFGPTGERLEPEAATKAKAHAPDRR